MSTNSLFVSAEFISLPALIAQRAAEQPHAVALSGAGQTLTYAELDRISRALALQLRALGAGAEAAVAVCLPRSPALFAALLAVLRAGAAYVPLDPAFPDERLRFLQTDAGVQLLLTDSDLGARIPEVAGVQRVLLDTLSLGTVSLDTLPLSAEIQEPEPAIHPEQLAYLIYTSGSTGTPKGVAVSHAALSTHMQAIATQYGMTPADRILHFISVSFDGAGEAWLAPLIAGASVVIGDPATWTPADINTALIKEPISIVGVSPAVLVQMAEAWRDASMPGVPPVRSYTVGGEAISREAFARIRDIFKPPRLLNGYGPTETVVTPLLWHWTPDTPDTDWHDTAYLPIGSPVGARRAYVLDADLNAVPTGVAGELFLGGILARGYHQRAALTAERFIPNPFSTNPGMGERLYRTGDRVRRTANGGFEYLGRIDQQLKLRGLRIEPGEIESRLLQLPGVNEAVVATTERRGQSHLVAYIGGTANAEELTTQLRASLPEYLIPAAFAIVAQLPRLPSGKLDRQHLPEPEWQQQMYIAPQGETEQQVAQLWAELLDLNADTIGRSDHFFALGGHSLLAARAVSRIRETFANDLNIADFLNNAVLCELASYIDAANTTAPNNLQGMAHLLDSLECSNPWRHHYE